MLNHYARTVIGVAISFSVLSTGLTAARIWARALTRRSLQFHDWIIVANTVINLAICGYLTWGALHAGVGKDRSELTAEEAIFFRKMLWTGELMITFVVGTVKVAVLLFYKQVFSTRKFGIIANIFIGLSCLWTVLFILLVVFKRFPVQNEWSLAPYVPHHLNAGAMWTSMGASDIFLDLCILALPFPVLSRLNVSKKRKIVLHAIMLLGVFVAITSAIRLNYFVRVEPVFGQPYYNFSDSVTNVIIWSVVESCFSIIAANLPLLAPLFKPGQGLHQLLTTGRTYAENLMQTMRSGSTTTKSTTATATSATAAGSRVDNYGGSAVEMSQAGGWGAGAGGSMPTSLSEPAPQLPPMGSMGGGGGGGGSSNSLSHGRGYSEDRRMLVAAPEPHSIV